MSDAAVATRPRIDDAVAALLAPARSIEVWPGHRHQLSIAEAAVVATPAFQRLTRLRQMGLAFHAFPNAENTRASHSLGVAYWSAVLLDALDDGEDGELSSALVARLFALLHDIDLLPLGHTLRYQSNLLREAAGKPRLAACVEAIGAHVVAHGFPGAPDRDALLVCFDRHLRAAAAARPGSTEPAQALAAELVNGMLGADLFDFALRDSFAIGRFQTLHEDYGGKLRLVWHGGRSQLAIDAVQAEVADDLYRARFEVFAASVNHPRKLAADAMLDHVVRTIEAESPDPRWRDLHLLTLGDDEFLDLIGELEAGTADEPLTPALRAGLLHDEVFRSTDLDGFARRADAGRALSLDAGWRNETEAALRDRLTGIAPGELIVAVSPERMQAKPPDILLVDRDGAVRPIAGAPGLRIMETAAAYRSLWSLRVYLAPHQCGRSDEVAAAAASLFAA